MSNQPKSPSSPSGQYEALRDLTITDPSNPSQVRHVKAGELFNASAEELGSLAKGTDYRDRQP